MTVVKTQSLETHDSVIVVPLQQETKVWASLIMRNLTWYCVIGVRQADPNVDSKQHGKRLQTNSISPSAIS